MEAEPVWDAHVHNWHGFAGLEPFRRHLERRRIARVNLLGPLLGGLEPKPPEVEASNERTLAFFRALPERVAAFCYVNPRHPRHAVAEWRRRRAQGFVGLKLWVAARCHEPCVAPVVEAAVEEGCPILVHTWSKAGGNLPGESTPEDLAALAARYPAGHFILAHAGGRFERGIAAARGLPNVWIDYAGSANEAGAYEHALDALGAGRILFGTDGPADFLACLGRVLEAVPLPAARRKILFENMAALMPPAPNL